MIAALVATVEAKNRVPDAYRVTFFSPYDIWLYHAVYDFKLCDDCRAKAEQGVFMGNHLRANFPWLQIVSTDRIDVNIHPHCRCYITRWTG